MRLAVLAAALAASLSAAAQEAPPRPPPPADGNHRVAAANAALVIADDGGFDHVTARTLRAVVAGELRKHGVSVWDDARFNTMQPVDGALSDWLRNLGVQRLFVLRIGGHLGKKVPLALEEADPDRLSTVFAADLVATGMEEADRNLARLVEAVLSRQSAGDTGAMQTVTAEEKRPFQEKPGRHFVALGFPFGFQSSTGRSYGAPVGAAFSYLYEAQFVRVDVDVLAEYHGSSSTMFAGVIANWVPFDRQVSPYVGAGVGYLVLQGSDGLTGTSRFGYGMAASVEGGVEAMRLQGFRILAGVQLLIPLFDSQSLSLGAPVTPLANLRFAF